MERARTVPVARFLGEHPGLIVTVAALVFGYYGIRGPSIWFDEAATWSAAIRPLDDLMVLMETKDRPLLPYYLLMHVVTLGGTSELWLRLPSLLAAAGAAGLTAVIGTRLWGPRAGLVAGLLLVLVPAWLRYAQEARPYAFVLLFVALATLALLNSERARWWWAVYAAALVGVAAAHLVALLIVPAHAVWAWRSARWRPWLAATGVAAVPIAAFAWWTLGQPDAQQSWSKTPGVFNFIHSGQYVLESASVFAVLVGIVVAGLRRRDLNPLLMTWLVLPPLVLFAAAQFTHAWVHRYLLFCVPALALAAGAALAGRRLLAALLAVVLVAVLSYPDQRLLRTSGGHRTDFRGAVKVMKEGGEAAVLVAPSWQRVTLDYYKWNLGPVTDVMRKERGFGGFSATEAPPAETSARLEGYDRVWWLHYVDSSGEPYPLKEQDEAKREALEREFAQVKTVRKEGVLLVLYERRDTAGS